MPDNPWQAHRESLKKHLREDDLSDFLRWSTVQATMYVGYSPSYLQHELDWLKAQPGWERYRVACERDGAFGDELIEGLGCNAVHQVYHLAQYEQAAQIKVEYMGRIVEFGGGYGEMAHVCYRLGFRGKYYLYDLPEVKTLQEYYLRKTTPFLDYVLKEPRHVAPMTCDLLIAIASLSETPPAVRVSFLDALKPNGALFLYQQTFEDYDNVSLFRDVTARWSLHWQGWPVEHYMSHHYLVGAK